MLAIGRFVQWRDGSKPRVGENFTSREPLGWVTAQKTANEAASLGRQGVGNVEVTPADLAEEGEWLGIVKGVPPHQHGVQHHAQAPHIRRLARVACLRRRQDLRAHIGWTAMFVLQHIWVVL